MAANCLRSLLVQSSPTPADQTIARYLLPRLTTFVTNTDPEDPERARNLVAHTLCQFVASLRKDRVPVAMALVVPALLSRASTEGEGGSADSGGLYRETSTRLLELASADQAAFRGVVAGMNDGQKAFVEEVIRSGKQTAAESDEGDGPAQPSIALKMDFGA